MPFSFNLKYFLFALGILGTESFFSICSLIGFGYDGESNSSLFAIYSLILYLIILLLSIKDLRNTKSIKKRHPILLVPFILTLFFCIDFISVPKSGLEWTLKSYQLFLILCAPMIYLGVNLSKEDSFKKVVPFMDVFMLIISLGIIITLPRLMTLGMMTTNGEKSDYNSISYYSAFCFGYFYYFLMSNNKERFLFFQRRLFKYFTVFLLICLAICVAVSGGRGGMVLMLLYFIVVPLLLKKNYIRIFIIYLFVGIVAFFIIDYLMSGNSEFATYLDYGLNRAFEYLSSDGVDMSKTSNRDEAYSFALNLIQESPLLGYGFFRTIGEFGYPHNFFLEILLDGGVVLLLFTMGILILLFKKIILMIKLKCNMIIIILSLYTFISLLFGGSYLMRGLFWFCVSYLLSSNVKQIKANKRVAS